MNKRIVAHIKEYYLSEPWLYNFITNFSNWKSVAITARIIDLSKYFPFDNLICLKPKYYKKLINYLSFKIFKRNILWYKEEYKKAVLSVRPQIIHCHYGSTGYKISSLRKFFNIPIITSFYGTDISVRPKKWFWRMAYKKLFARGDKFFTLGSQMKNKLIKLGCPPEKIEIVHLGVNLDKLPFKYRILSQNDKVTFLTVCNLVKTKGVSYAIKAFARVYQKYKNIELRIIGAGPLKKEIEKLISDLNSKDCVTLLGYQPQFVVIKEAMNAHIFLAPFITVNQATEGTPTVLMEMQAMGLPIISTRHSDVPEIVINNKSGFLVEEKDEVALAEKMIELIENPVLLKKFGEFGRKHIEENYNIKKICQQVEKIYFSFASLPHSLRRG